jgi:dihydropteroate synthase
MIATQPISAKTAATALLPSLLSRPYPAVMGVLNVTPDSFSDGGQFAAPDHALAQARKMIAEGADIIDIGAESTRPYDGSQPVSAEEELKRLHPVLPDVVALGVPVSIDSMKSEVVAGRSIPAQRLPTTSGPAARYNMAALVASRHSPIIIMHNRDRADPSIDIMKDICAFSRDRSMSWRKLSTPDQIVLDPGIGFGKIRAEHDRAGASRRTSLVWPAASGRASRKRFISTVSPSEPHQRLGGSIAAQSDRGPGGAAIIRTHDVAETAQALRVAAAIREQQ